MENKNTLSERLWGIDMCSQLPVVLSKDGIRASRGKMESIRPYLIKEFPTFTEGSINSSAIAKVKARYFYEICDLIELKIDDRTIGVIIGEPEDWSTYYVRVYALSAGYQRPYLTRRFAARCLFEPLIQMGVMRVVAETSPTNIAMIRGLCEVGFFVTGNELSERYGPMLRFTKLLDETSKESFLKQYAGTSPIR